MTSPPNLSDIVLGHLLNIRVHCSSIGIGLSDFDIPCGIGNSPAALLGDTSAMISGWSEECEEKKRSELTQARVLVRHELLCLIPSLHSKVSVRGGLKIAELRGKKIQVPGACQLERAW